MYFPVLINYMDHSYAIVIISNQAGLKTDDNVQDFKKKITLIAAAVGDYTG